MARRTACHPIGRENFALLQVAEQVANRIIEHVSECMPLASVRPNMLATAAQPHVRFPGIVGLSH
jgi:creatinine amidohydrolase/Fe(II)-dependent formamide hydrolase-like protein